MINLLMRPDFEHKNMIMLNVKIGKYSIPFEYFLTLKKISENHSDTTFNFYYYENIFQEFLLDKKIIVLDYTDENGCDWYKFRKYDKFLKLTDTIVNLFELNSDELKADYRSTKISNITD